MKLQLIIVKFFFKFSDLVSLVNKFKITKNKRGKEQFKEALEKLKVNYEKCQKILPKWKNLEPYNTDLSNYMYKNVYQYISMAENGPLALYDKEVDEPEIIKIWPEGIS